MASLTDRMIRASKLDPSVFEEVEADPSTMGQAMVSSSQFVPTDPIEVQNDNKEGTETLRAGVTIQGASGVIDILKVQREGL